MTAIRPSGMLKLAVVGATMVVSVAFAQQSVPTPTPDMRAQMEARMEQRFKAADTGNKGYLTREDAQKSMPRMVQDFDKLDANHDGKLTFDELKAGMAQRMAQRPMPGPRGAKGGPGARAPQGAGMGFFERADANRDGVVSREEFDAYLKQMNDRAVKAFEAADTNHDGKVTREEAQAAREKMRQQFDQKRRGDMPPPPPAQ